MATVRLTDRDPGAPSADFGFEIDFVRGGPASRVFTATRDFIRVCEALDDELVRSIDNSIETVLALEDIESGSIKTWFRNMLLSTDDEALKSGDWKRLVGAYLVRAKYAIIAEMDETGGKPDLPKLRREIQSIAADTDVRHLPDYAPPSPAALVQAIKGFDQVKQDLMPGDKAALLTQDGRIPFDLTVRIDIESIEALAIARTIEVPPAEMILPVKKPDYLGSSQWELRHGRRNIHARIEDEEWLQRFQKRGEDVRPGDALRCIVRVEYNYGFDNELLNEKYTVLEVLEVLIDRSEMLDLPFGDSEVLD